MHYTLYYKLHYTIRCALCTMHYELYTMHYTLYQGLATLMIKRATFFIITIRGPDRALQLIGYERSYKIIPNKNKIFVYICLYVY